MSSAFQPLVEVRFLDRQAVRSASAVVADVAASQGIGPDAQVQLQALTMELIHAVLRDSFDEGEQVDLTLEIHKVPGELLLALDYHGSPTSFRRGDLPPRVDTLVALGFADALEIGSSGIRGNRAVIRKSLPEVSLTDDAAFTAQATSDDPPDPDDAQITARLMTVDDVVGVARLYFRTYGYTKLLTPYVYDPDLFTELLHAKRHLGTVAVTEDGRVVGHLGLLRDAADSSVGCNDTLAVEPAFRGRGIVAMLVAPQFQDLLRQGVTGVYGEAVTMHTASQKASLQIGGKETAVLLGRQPPEVQLEGFDAVDARRALILMYHRLLPLAPLEVHAPPAYAEILAKIYEHAGFDRTLAEHAARAPDGLPAGTVLDIEFLAAQRMARIAIVEYGEDFLAVLQDLFHRLDADGYELCELELPLADPGTAHFGSGLGEFGVCFNGVMPDDKGDTLLLARCTGPVDTASIQTASDFGAMLRDFVVADHRRVWEGSNLRARSRAAMARIYEAL